MNEYLIRSITIYTLRFWSFTPKSCTLVSCIPIVQNSFSYTSTPLILHTLLLTLLLTTYLNLLHIYTSLSFSLTIFSHFSSYLVIYIPICCHCSLFLQPTIPIISISKSCSFTPQDMAPVLPFATHGANP